MEALWRMQTSEEAQPLGQDVGGFGLDQDLPAVQSHTGAHLPAHVKHARLLPAEKQFRIRHNLISLVQLEKSSVREDS